MGRPPSCSCFCSVPMYGEIGRRVLVVGPQASGGKSEDTTWVFGKIALSEITSTQDSFWKLSPSTSGWVSDPDTGRAEKRFKMYPMRWEIGTIDNDFASHFWQRSLIQTVALAALTPDSASHLNPFTISQFRTPCAFPRILPGNNVAYYYPIVKSATVVWYRLWVDGVDATGIVACAQKVYFRNGDRPFRGDQLDVNALDVTIPTPTTAVGKTVWVDLWLDITMQTLAFPPGASTVDILCAHGGLRTTNMFMSKSSVNANRSKTDRYQLTFDANGPGGATTLVLEPTAGWTFVEEGPTKIMIHSGSGDRISFIWSSEHPQIVVYRPSQINLPYAGTHRPQCAYYPTGSTPYHAYTNIGGANQLGSWNPSGTTVFPIYGRYVVGFQTGDYYAPTSLLNSGSGNSFFNNFPHAITMVKL